MPQLSPVDVLPSLRYRIDSQCFQATNASDPGLLEAASFNSMSEDTHQTLLREVERQREQIRVLRMQLAGRATLDDQDVMDA
jgi:hypothetical protein